MSKIVFAKDCIVLPSLGVKVAFFQELWGDVSFKVTSTQENTHQLGRELLPAELFEVVEEGPDYVVLSGPEKSVIVVIDFYSMKISVINQADFHLYDKFSSSELCEAQKTGKTLPVGSSKEATYTGSVEFSDLDIF